MFKYHYLKYDFVERYDSNTLILIKINTTENALV